MSKQFTASMLMSVSLGLVLVGSAQAADVYGLSTRDQLIRFDSATPGSLASAVFISGLGSNESLLGIDFRPSNGKLYGVGSFGNIYTLNTVTGAASFVSNINVGGNPVGMNGVEYGIDFNPVADRLRLISDLDMNLRINVDTGATTVDGTITNSGGGNPNIVASAYTNSDNNASTGTALYNLDSFSNQLTIQNPPNAGTQTNVGALGFDISALAGFDILTVGATNTAYAAMQNQNGSGSSFYTIDLGTGLATSIGVIGNSQSSDSLAIRDIALTPVPEPATMAVLGIGVAALLRRKRK